MKVILEDKLAEFREISHKGALNITLDEFSFILNEIQSSIIPQMGIIDKDILTGFYYILETLELHILFVMPDPEKPRLIETIESSISESRQKINKGLKKLYGIRVGMLVS